MIILKRILINLMLKIKLIIFLITGELVEKKSYMEKGR